MNREEKVKFIADVSNLKVEDVTAWSDKDIQSEAFRLNEDPTHI